MDFVLTACRNHDKKSGYIDLRYRTEYFLNAADSLAKTRYLAPDYQSYFGSTASSPADRNAAIRSFLNWDANLNPDVRIRSFKQNRDTVMVDFLEENDFSKLIGYPGWKGAELIYFNKIGLIRQSVYLPDSTNPPYRTWLEPALDWLQKHLPDSLNEIYKNNNLVRSAVASHKWVRLLKKWRAEK